MSQLFDALQQIHGAVPDATMATHPNTDVNALNGHRASRRITAIPSPESHILSGSDRQNSAREHFKYIEHKLCGLRKSAPLKRILITSSAPKEGKTVVAANLATTLASGSSRVLLVDGDMRAGGTADLFGLGEAPGLAELLEARAEPSEVLTYLENLNIHYVPAGVPSGSPGDLLQGTRLASVLTALGDFEWIIIDSPPMATFADSLSLATQVDTVVLVARAGVTERADLERALAALKDNHSAVAAVVLNACDQPRKKNGYYAHYDGLKSRA